MRSLNDYFLTGRIADLSTAGQVYIPCPDGGNVIACYATLNNAITSADATITVKTANGTVGTVTCTQSGSAAGSTFSNEFESNAAEGAVPTGGYIEVETDGGSSTTCITEVVVVVRR